MCERNEIPFYANRRISLSTPPTIAVSPWPHRLAVLLVCATFPLIWIGGLVTTTGAGMAFPRWLTIDGRFFAFYSLERWLGGLWDQFIEHGHRLSAIAVGLLTLLLAAVIWRCEPRRWVRWLGLAAVAGVCFQGLLGGLRVELNRQTLAMVHGCVAPLFLALCVAIAVFTSRWWQAGPGPSTAQTMSLRDSRLLLRLSVATAMLAYLQLILGAWLRHLAAGSTGEAFRMVVVFHLVLAAAVAGHALYLAHVAFWKGRRQGRLLRPALSLAVLVVVQVLLGGGTWINKYGWPDGLAQYEFAQRFLVVPGSAAQMWITTAHAAVGSLILATALVMALRAARLSSVTGETSTLERLVAETSIAETSIAETSIIVRPRESLAGEALR
jgi:cytochrome c oxidase assembly protein subunit 15